MNMCSCGREKKNIYERVRIRGEKNRRGKKKVEKVKDSAR